MSEDYYIGASEKVAYRRGSLHEDTPSFGVAECGGVLYGLTRFLALPDLVSDVRDHGYLEFVVLLGKRSHSNTLHNGV